MDKTCKICGTPFVPYRPKNIYCSRKCSGISRSRTTKRKIYMREYFRRYYASENGRKRVRAAGRKWENSSAGKLFRKMNKGLRFGRNRGRYSRREWRELLVRFDGKCVNCGTQENIEPDHIIPLSKGGSNTIKNIQPLCKTCNRKKFTKIYDPDAGEKWQDVCEVGIIERMGE